ncbi:hypothetical protein [Rhizobium sp. C4]|uniref:hypothetical protein n=1 Tax=Rhizobium sp. C4 TaxID=1349800 RepID=UPI001E4B9D99|nr:hypothetical protein [Rhizobium sp. C4]MCD2171887.1 hypothetical protein [Rhizobium sp. C4]
MPAEPRRNRVTPFGRLEAVPARGQLMGNRGDLRDRSGAIVRDWKVPRWIACRLTHPRGLLVTFDKPGRYTPLFFADEPTALAAGHRPCAECRREDYKAWQEGWRLAFGIKPSSAEMDAALHAARIGRDGSKRMTQALIGDLPDGVMVTMADAPATPLLLWRQQLHPWTHDGYGAPRQVARSASCTVLTPSPSVAVLAALASAGAPPWPGFADPRL